MRTSRPQVKFLPDSKVILKALDPGEVLYNSGDTFKTVMSDHVDLLIDKMEELEIITTKASQEIKAKGKAKSVDYLLGLMKKIMSRSMDKFGCYLELLVSFAMTPEGDRDDGSVQKDEKNDANELTLHDSTMQLLRIMSGSLKASKPPDSRLEKAIVTILDIVDSSAQNQTSIQKGKMRVDHSPSPDPLSSSAQPPPPGQLGPGHAVSATFTNEGGILYSPLHGVTVIIPPNAIPGKCMYSRTSL